MYEYIYIVHIHIYRHVDTHIQLGQKFHQTVLTFPKCNPWWYFQFYFNFYNYGAHYLDFYGVLMSHGLKFGKYWQFKRSLSTPKPLSFGDSTDFKNAL